MIFIGILLLLVAAGLLRWRQVTVRKLTAMTGAETVPCADLAALRDAAAEAAGPGSFRLACEVIGTAEAGDAGLLTAELSSTKCVWHRHVVRRRYESVSTDSKGNRTRTTTTERVAEHSTSTPFVVRDASGTMVVDPGDVTIDRAERVVNRFDPAGVSGLLSVTGLSGVTPSGGGTLGYEYEEWVVRPGQRMYVLGEASDRDGRFVIAKPEEGQFVVSTRSEEELTRGATRDRMIATIAAPVAAVAGLALVVAGVLS
jgi:E3 Ubiquitin ligase